MIRTKHGKFSDKMGVQEVLLETGRRGASWAWGSAELPRGGDNVGGTLKGAAGVSSHCRGRISRTSQLIRCRCRRRKAEAQRVKRFQDWMVSRVNTSLMLAQKTERYMFACQEGTGRVFDFI